MPLPQCGRVFDGTEVMTPNDAPGGDLHDRGDGHAPGTGDRFWRSRAGIAFTAFAALVALYLVYEHRLHVLGALPWLLLLCPLMHLLMHGGHGHGHGGHGGGARGRGGAA